MGIFMTMDIIIYEAVKGKLYISDSVKISLFSLLWKAGPPYDRVLYALYFDRSELLLPPILNK